MNWAFWKSKDKDHNKDVTVPPGNPKKGKQIYDEHCGGCHELDGNAQSLEAPPLRYIMGERVANTGYDYSRAMKRANFRWTPQDMEEFLLSPKKKVPGNSMSFTGIRNAAERSDLIAYLIFLSGT